MNEFDEADEVLKAAIEQWHRDSSTDKARVLTSWIVVAASHRFDEDGRLVLGILHAKDGNKLERAGLSQWLAGRTKGWIEE